MSINKAHDYFSFTLFEDFFESLAEKGLTIDMDDYIVAAQLRKQFINGEISLERFKHSLAAIICRNEDEQILYYQLFEIKIKKLEQTLPPPTPTSTPTPLIDDPVTLNKKQILLGFVCFLVVVLTLIPFFKTDQYVGKEMAFPDYQHITTDDIIQYAALDRKPKAKNTEKDTVWSSKQSLYQLLFDPKYDTVGLKVNWNLQDTLVPNKKDIQYRFKTPGKKIVSFDFVYSGVKKNTLSDTLTVCEPSPIIKKQDTIVRNKQTVFIATHSGNKPIAWRVNELDTITKDSVLKYTFKKGVNHSISCKTQKQQCPHNNSNTINFKVNNEDLFTLDGKPSTIYNPITSKSLSPLFYSLAIIFGIILLCCLLIMFIPKLYTRFKEILGNYLHTFNKNSAKKYYDDVTDPKLPGDDLPVNIQFFNKDRLIKGKEVLRKLGLDLQKKMATDDTKLSLSDTIKASIKNYDLITPVYQNKNSKRSYLILIDTNYSNPRVKLFLFLANFLTKNQVDADFYFFDKNPIKVYKRDVNDSVNINRLKDNYYESVLIVLGNGYNFLDENHPEIDETIKEKFSYWNKRTLITPVPSLDWSANEKILASFFHIVPADTNGLLALFSLLQKGVYNQNVFSTEDFNTYESKLIEFNTIEKLKTTYLTDEKVFQWVCAIAVYPKIHWEVILTIGAAIDENMITYENLLKISRIRWVIDGVFPTRIRLDLLKQLSKNNEIIARNAVIKLLEEESAIIEKSVSNNERIIQLIINKFILFSFDPKKYSLYEKEEKEFLQLYEMGNFRDTALKIYLQGKDPDKPNQTWESSLNKSEKSHVDNLESYYNNKTNTIAKQNVQKIIDNLLSTIAASAFILLTCLLILSAVESMFTTNFNILIHESTPKTIWTFAMEKDDCYKNFNPVRLKIYNDSTTLFNNKIVENQPIESPQFGSGFNSSYKFEMISDQNDTISSKITINGQIIILKIKGDKCSSESCGVYIQYFPERIKDSVTAFQNRLTQKNYNPCDGLDYQKSGNQSQIRYFNKNDKSKAEKLAKEAVAFFNQKIGIVEIPQTDKTKVIPIEVWIVKPLRVLFKNTTSKRLEAILKRENYLVSNSSDQNNDAINTLLYSDKSKIEEVKELAITMVNNKIPLKVITLVSNLKNHDFEIGSGNYSSNEFKNLTVDNINKEVFIKKENNAMCVSSGSNNRYTLYYKFDSAQLDAKGTILLDKIADQLLQYPSKTIEISGYAQSASANYSLSLAQRQAKPIQNYLISKGIAASRITTKGRISKGGSQNSNCYNKSEIVITQTEGYLFYGINSYEKWSERHFINLREADPLAEPIEGDEIQSIEKVNIREHEIQFINGIWKNGSSLGVLTQNTIVKVKKVIKVAGGGYVWIVYDLNKTRKGKITPTLQRSNQIQLQQNQAEPQVKR